ncbi:HAD-IIB family hydrolase [Promicromonospora sp. NPDC050249]|uniref:HAD-IIB family hydrolase n=1 Tax=Promicromonospora sp. NPDC050249 TaxID=3154743 RepID=UPI0033C97435
MISAVAFDLDDTLAHSKSPISSEMATLLMDLVRLVPVCIISGGRYEQFEDQLLRRLPDGADSLFDLHLMPTCGTRYYRYESDGWVLVYAEDLDEYAKIAAFAAIESEAKRLGLWEQDSDVFGSRIEDRGSQITYSALGQEAPVQLKKTWDPNGRKREKLRKSIQRRLPDLEVRSGGSTSIDITRKGIDKAFGMREFAKILNVSYQEILFIGDRLEPGGNDYPVVPLGLITRSVANCEETEALLPQLISEVRETQVESGTRRAVSRSEQSR